MLTFDSKQKCPACGGREGVEVVHAHPIEERARTTDRRQQNLPNLIPQSGDRRQLKDRRVRSEWHCLPGTEANPLICCLECLHEWRLLSGSTQPGDAMLRTAIPSS